MLVQTSSFSPSMTRNRLSVPFCPFLPRSLSLLSSIPPFLPPFQRNIWNKRRTPSGCSAYLFSSLQTGIFNFFSSLCCFLSHQGLVASGLFVVFNTLNDAHDLLVIWAFLPSPLPKQTVPCLNKSSKMKLTQAVKIRENTETSETEKLPVKYVEIYCMGSKLSNGFDSFLRNWRRLMVV